MRENVDTLIGITTNLLWSFATGELRLQSDYVGLDNRTHAKTNLACRDLIFKTGSRDSIIKSYTTNLRLYIKEQIFLIENLTTT